ncbi:hypothetical protein R7040_18200 [Vibrio sp. 1069]|uniref:hypothetical protein n=1 Tax=unclassified Vibrio TaxID=2614977 RepID=UPI0029645A62|nr:MULTISPECIES: hypothetical protein [unclassified Vibrio]MDW1763138.1 hypothetical protein [Vibrio sp. Vb2135]MDW2333026.1 hypothetical protein [Vibrio sp. 1069]
MNNCITMKVVKRHVVSMRAGRSMVELRTPSRTRLNVVSLGKQGPVGTVAEEVLKIATEAQTVANEAKAQSSQVAQEQTLMVDGMTMTIDHYIGVIGVQE